MSSPPPEQIKVMHTAVTTHQINGRPSACQCPALIEAIRAQGWHLQRNPRRRP